MTTRFRGHLNRYLDPTLMNGTVLPILGVSTSTDCLAVRCIIDVV